MRRAIWIVLPTALAAAAFAPGTAHARGGDYVFDGGSAAARAEVKRALDASAFDWGAVPERITIHIRRGVSAQATAGHIWLDEELLRAGRFAWAVVQDEYAHQVDFFLLDDGVRARLGSVLGAKAWCRDGRSDLRHSDYGCERFASTLVWAFWPSPHNAYRPRTASDESAAVPADRFRSLVSSLLQGPRA
jgi:hypothetical protein